MSAGAPPLPELRPELRLAKGAAGYSGEPSWLIQDPIQGRNIQLDLASYETLAHWRESRSLDELVARVNANGRVAVDRPTVEKLVEFLHQNNLTVAPVKDGWRHFVAQRQKQRHAPHTWLLHNYLFFRIPFWRPQRFLDRTLPAVRWLAAPAIQWAIAIAGLIGIYLVSRQWEAYLSTYQDFVSLEGIILGALTLAGIKAAHELGHAYVAVHFGCRVPTMGAAFMLLAPMLYTDVSDAWKLRDRRQRMHIDSAGVRVELAIAAIALFLWPFLPEGPLKGAAFMLSAISLLTSLMINLNPFMRFDAYYLLSEFLQVENLQPRSFALGRWKLREWLFDLRHPCPEEFPGRLRATLIAYAWSVWVYRLVLFVGIALLVYHHFFKALGIVLFAVEIVFFVLKPIVSEILMWMKLKAEIRSRPRTFVTGAAVGLLLIAAVVPWSTRVEIPAVVEAGELAQIHPPRPARIVSVHASAGGHVRAGDPLVTLEAPELAEERRITEIRLALAKVQQNRRGADEVDREASLVTGSSITSLKAKLEGLLREEADLVVRAPIDGTLVELNPELHAGRWIAPREQIATIAGGSGATIRGYVAEADLWRISVGSPAAFIPDSVAFAKMPATVAAIGVQAASQVHEPELASLYGGLIAAHEDKDATLVPEQAQYAVTLTSAGPAVSNGLSIRGLVIADGEPESLLSRTWRQVLNVLVRESGA